MLPLTKEYKPSCRRLSIKNKIRITIILLLILCTLSTILIHRAVNSQTIYIPYKVRYGETYWGIANELQQAGYKPFADIRAIVHELVTESGIPAHQLKEGDTILIPDLGGD